MTLNVRAAVRRVPLIHRRRVAFDFRTISTVGLKPRPGPAYDIRVRFKWPIDDRSQRQPITGTVGRCARDSMPLPASAGYQFDAGDLW